MLTSTQRSGTQSTGTTRTGTLATSALLTSTQLGEEYARRRVAAEVQRDRSLARAAWIRPALLGVAAVLFLWAHRMHGFVSLTWVVVAVLAVASAMAWFIVWRGRARRAERVMSVYVAGERRLQGEAAATVRTIALHSAAQGEDGARFVRPGHLYAWDLDVVGKDSLFTKLASTRTERGDRALAALLLEPSGDARTMLGRQAAVRELAASLHLRERVWLLGRSPFDQLQSDAFDRWLASEVGGQLPAWLAPLLLALTLGWLLALLVVPLSALLPSALPVAMVTATALRTAVVLLAAQAVVAIVFRPRVQAELQAAKGPAGPLELLRDALAVLGDTPLEAEALRRLQRVVGPPALAALRSLERTQRLLEQRDTQAFYLPSLLFAVGTQMAVRLSRWRARHGAELLAWTAAWGEFDALVALATYAAEHAEDAWPVIVDSKRDTQAPVGNDNKKAETQGLSARFEATALRHPLLGRDAAVANDVSLGGDTARVMIVSGSNMAGKSTLLRAVGCNAVLAMAGAPVAAASLRMSALSLAASLAVRDSLAEGTSKFRAEVERLAATVELAQSEPTLFLVDEILSGTNSVDRGVAAEAVVRALVEAGAVGLLSTHDLTLTAMNVAGTRNVHMRARGEDDPLDFDYTLRDGVNTQTNGLAIVRLLGLKASG